MLKVQILDRSGKKIDEMSAPEEVLSVPHKEHLIYEAVVGYRANQRRGTASTKTRGEVRGGGRKPWKQKGTGRARVGSIRSPLWKKGGTVFGPKPRSYETRMSKMAKRIALKSAISTKFAENQLLVLDALDFNEPKTKGGAKLLEILNLDSVLFVDQHENKNLFLVMRNIPKVKVVDFNYINVYDILNHKGLVFAKRAFESLVEKLK